MSYGDIQKYTDIYIFGFKELEECSSWASRNGTVQMFFLTSNRNMFAGKAFGCVVRAYYFQRQAS